MATAQLDKILLDGSTTIQQKIDCLKLLKVVTKNLSDPAKSSDPKYRQLKLDNEKVRSKLLACAAAVPLLQALGFCETIDTDGGNVLRVDGVVDHAAMSRIMTDIVSTLSQLDGPGNAQNKKPKLDANNVVAVTAVVAKPTTVTTVEKLSEKQKARLLSNEKAEEERAAAKAHRKANVALLKQDKHVRQNDENWTSGVSAACAKSGNSISTFRDKYGECKE